MRVRDAVVSADGQLHPFNMSARDMMVLREAAVFDGIIGFAGTNMTLIGGDPPNGSASSGRRRASRRRCCRPPSDAASARWNSADWPAARRSSATDCGKRFRRLAAVLGSTFRLDDRRFPVIGVMAPLYAFFLRRSLASDDAGSGRSFEDFAVFGQMRPGVAAAQVRAALPALPSGSPAVPRRPAGFTFEAMTIQENLSGNQTGTLRALTIRRVPSAHGLHQRRDAAAGALGIPAPRVRCRRSSAPGHRHLRQLLAESLVLAGLGCGAGAADRGVAERVYRDADSFGAQRQLGLATLHTDWRVAGFAVGISLISASIAAVIPAFGSWNARPRSALADGGRATQRSRRTHARRLIVAPKRR